MKALLGISLISVLGLSGAPTQAAAIFFDDQATFTAAMTTAGNRLIGIETFEEAMLPPGPPGPGNTANDPLTQGVANGPFPAGLLQPLTVQSNMNGVNSLNTNPRGTLALGIAPGDLTLPPNYVVYPNATQDSLDLIFSASAALRGIGLNTFLTGQSEFLVTVFNTGNVLLGTNSVSAGSFEPFVFSGIQATGADLIGRINIASPSPLAEGVDNVMLFALTPAATAPPVMGVPEPGSSLLVGIACAALVTSQQRRKP